MTGPRGIDLLHGEARGRRGLPMLQYVEEPDVIDLTWGHPDPTLLPVDEVAAATEAMLQGHGWKALTYGFAAGPAPLTESLIDYLPTIGERRPAAGELVVTSGNSSALSMILGLFSRPGDVVLVESPTYFLALRIIADHPVTVVGVPCDEQGVIPEALDRLAAQAVSNRGSRFVYTVPTHSNPRGATTSLERRVALLDVGARRGLTFIEDDVYRELSWLAAPGEGLPPSMWSVARGTGVVRLSSFSKTIGPGLRLGYLTAPAEMASRITESGVLDSGGGVNHFTACVVGTMVSDGSYRRVRERVTASYAERCAALARGLATPESQLGFVAPGGGYFIWLKVPDSISSGDFVAAARARGVACSNGSIFYPGDVDGAGNSAPGPVADHVRLSFSLYQPDVLEAAGRLLATTFRPRI